jgi:hypothetical protein
MLNKFTREFLKVDGEAGEGEEMSEEAPLDMDDDDAIEIIDPEGLLLSDEEEGIDEILSDDDAGENGLEGENEDVVQVPYVPERDDAKFTFNEHKGWHSICTHIYHFVHALFIH